MAKDKQGMRHNQFAPAHRNRVSSRNSCMPTLNKIQSNMTRTNIFVRSNY